MFKQVFIWKNKELLVRSFYTIERLTMDTMERIKWQKE